jgi:excinuclease ABC subunit B
VSLVAILDADKEGFLRSDRALIQTIGRAARNVHSKAILYGDSITGSMQRAIDLTNRHRDKQIKYNMEHGIVPRQIVKSTEAIIGTTSVIERAAEERTGEKVAPHPYKEHQEQPLMAAEEPQEEKQDSPFMAMTKEQLRKEIRERQRKMQIAAKELNFLDAARYRDEIKELQTLLTSAR